MDILEADKSISATTAGHILSVNHTGLFYRKFFGENTFGKGKQ
jgi:hypothetical protein